MATLVERSTRFTQLVRIEKIDPKHLAAALGSHIVALPEQFTIDTGLAVYFRDPKSPWQRATNENTPASPTGTTGMTSRTAGQGPRCGWRA